MSLENIDNVGLGSRIVWEGLLKEIEPSGSHMQGNAPTQPGHFYVFYLSTQMLIALSVCDVIKIAIYIIALFWVVYVTWA